MFDPDASLLLAVNCRKHGTILGREQGVTERAAIQLRHQVGIPAAWIMIIYAVAMSKMTWVLSKGKGKTILAPKNWSIRNQSDT